MLRKHLKSKLIPVIMGILILVISLNCVSAQLFLSDSPHFFIESRFILWDSGEKMIDSNFTITIINKTGFYYNVQIDNNNYNNYTNDSMVKLNFTIETKTIALLKISVNNITIGEFTKIIIQNNVNQSTIQHGSNIFTINLRPMEWSKKEWNIFYALIFGSLLSLLIGYRITKRYRKSMGIKTIK